jgi:aerobic-type carbon monoxide dehydrogenase small subunit (CoxS/CutS family)
LNWFLQSHFTCFCNCFFAIVVTWLFLQLFFCNHTAIRLQSHCDKVAITHMRQGCNHAHAGFATVFLQSQHISGCNHTVTDFAITRIFTRLQPHQANTNLVAI